VPAPGAPAPGAPAPPPPLCAAGAEALLAPLLHAASKASGYAAKNLEVAAWSEASAWLGSCGFAPERVLEAYVKDLSARAKAGTVKAHFVPQHNKYALVPPRLDLPLMEALLLPPQSGVPVEVREHLARMAHAWKERAGTCPEGEAARVEAALRGWA
jgi:hypothetical protein